MANIPIIFNGDFHFTEKVKGIKTLYTSLDKYPNVCPVIINCWGTTRLL
jgi:hypothetical protein